MTIEASEDRITRYLKLAIEARALAQVTQSPAARDVMLEVADTWERLAQIEERDAERKTALSPD